MRKILEIGGLVAAAVLIAFGIGAIAMGVDGRSTVQSALEQEKIVGSPDMTPETIAAEAKEAGLASTVALPTCNVAGVPIDSGDRARCFASYMRIHALEATGGLTYSQMPRFATDDGKGTNEPADASKDADGNPVSNPARQIWVTETALSTALNTSFFAEQVAMFSLMVGIALLLVGIGFVVLTFGLHSRHANDEAG